MAFPHLLICLECGFTEFLLEHTRECDGSKSQNSAFLQ
jgi:hypothetical protein